MRILTYYRAALYLCAAIALTDAVWVLVFVAIGTSAYASALLITLAATIITIVGLVLGSNFIRYFGALVMMAWAAGLLGGLFLGGSALLVRPIYLATFFAYVFSATLRLLAAAFLVCSKQFAFDFQKRRQCAPTYIRRLRLSLVGVVVAAMLFATFDKVARVAGVLEW